MSLYSLKQLKYKGFIIASALLITLSLVVFVGINAGAVFTTPISLTTTTAQNPAIAVDGTGMIHAVWVERSAGGSDIIYSSSTDDGATFPVAGRINLSNSPTLQSLNPQIEIDSLNNIYVAWEEEDETFREPEIFGVKSSNGGASFSATMNLSNDSLFSGSVYLDTDSSNVVHVVWSNLLPDELYYQAYYSTSTNGAVWSGPTNISNVSHDVEKPIIRTRNNTVGVIWQAEGPDYGIYRVLSTNNGNTFGSALNISTNNTIKVTDPAIGIDGSDNAHVVAAGYTQPEGPEIFYSRSEDGGSTFASPVNLSNSVSNISADPNILAAGVGTVYVIWSENVCPESGDCKKSILLRSSSDGGATFGAAISPDALQVLSSVEELDIDRFGLNVYMIWQQSGVIQFMKGSQ